MTRSLRALALSALVLPAVAACDLLSSDPEPETIRLSRTVVTLEAIGDTAQVSATVIDDEGQEMPDQPVTWTSSDPGVATVSSTGLITAVANGSAAVRAESGSASQQLNVNVNIRVEELELVGGGSLEGPAGQQLDDPVRVLALDAAGNGIPGVEIRFSVIAGDGSLDASNVETGSDGIASVEWTLGEVAGADQTLRVTAPPASALLVEAQATPGPVDEVRVVGGAGQAGLVSAVLLTPVRVLAADGFGNPVPNVVVDFATPDGGSLNPAQATTDATGTAETFWTLGPQGGTQSATVSAAGGLSAQVQAEAVTNPDRLVIVAGPGSQGVAGQLLGSPVVVRLEDDQGQGIAGLPVIFETADGGTLVSPDDPGGPGTVVSVTTDVAGEATLDQWTLGPTVGSQVVSAQFAGILPVEVQVDVDPAPAATVELVSGDFQTAETSSGLAEPIVFRARDAFGNLVPGAEIQLDPASGSGSVSSSTIVTDASGEASVEWTLGPVVGLQTLEASVSADVGAAAYAAGLRPTNGEYTVDFAFLADTPPNIWAAFQLAGNRWSEIITGDVPDVVDTFPAGSCGLSSPSLVNETIDDLLILVEVVEIDGPGSILGQAGPCFIRDDGSNLPVLGRMRLDVEDLQQIDERGLLIPLILHEAGHVIGIGTIWGLEGLLAEPSLDFPGADTHFTGTQAIAAFDAVGGTPYTGAKVPVENFQGGRGTQDSHWRESVFVSELMTGFIDPVSNPLSTVTAASLGDLGYQVELGQSDNYTLPSDPAAVMAPLLSGGGVHLVGDILRMPLRYVTPNGRRTVR